MKFIEGIHIHKTKTGEYKIKQGKKYIWSVPEKLEKENISKGDIVLVDCLSIKAPVIVFNIFEGQTEKTNHKRVIKILDKNKK